MDGSIGVIEIKPGKPGVSGYSRGVVRDITDIRRTQQLLKETEIRYQSIVELSPDAIVLATVEGSIIDFNEKALRLFNYQNKNEVLGLWIGSFVDPDEQTDMQTLLVDAIQNGERLYAEVSLLRSDKSKFIAEVSAKLLGRLDDKASLLLILARDITEKKMAEEQLKRLSDTDPLTKLFNRRGFLLAAEQALRYAKRIKIKAIVMYMDLNGMKQINDNFSHSMGDAALVAVAQTLKTTFRDSDVIGRMGGDEFTAVALDATLANAHVIISRIRKNLKKYHFPVTLSLACGVVEYDYESDSSLLHLLNLADKEMYHDKKHNDKK
jgi:diguanylate cyclase (GGDEF)-like protein/PAS domain S-box-containing protein